VFGLLQFFVENIYFCKLSQRFSPMTLTQLKKLVLQGEGQYLEFKARANHPDKIVREMVAFANAKGGILLIGVGDQGQINGLKFADEDEFEMDQTILKYCQPMIAYHCVHVSVSADRHVLVYDIKESMEKPVYCLYDFKKQIGKAYLRMGDKSVLISAEMRQVLKNQRNTEGVKIFYGMRESALLK